MNFISMEVKIWKDLRRDILFPVNFQLERDGNCEPPVLSNDIKTFSTLIFTDHRWFWILNGEATFGEKIL